LRTATLGVVVAAACLDRNPAYDAPADGSSTDASSDAGTDGGDGTSTGAMCVPDGYEPNDDVDAPITVGSFSLVLETAGAVDRFTVFLGADGPSEIGVTADNPDVRVCGFVRCDGTADSALVTCTTGLSGGSGDSGYPGCCGGPAIGVDYECNAAGGAKIYVVVDGAAADCTAYGLEVATSVP
jgi:hypothetical protein